MVDDVGGGTAGAWDKGTWDNVNPLGPLDGGTAGGRVRFDTAHELVARLRKLEAVADAARAVRAMWLPLEPNEELGAEGVMLCAALDALDKEE